jgi:ParB family chromosome partitioning protein
LIPETEGGAHERIQEASVVAVRPNPYQPRRSFDEAKLAELAESIRQHGLLQPLIVRATGEGYELVAGERRLRAAVMAGMQTVPVVVRDVDEGQMLEMALVENLQREDLDPIEEARGYQALLARGRSQEEVASLVGKSRPAVANAVRLLQLPPEVQAMVARGELTPGHARALLSLPPEQVESVARQVVQEELRVRDVERLATATARPRRAGLRYPQWEEQLTQRFRARVRIVGSERRGRIVLEFRGEEELQRLLAELLAAAEEEGERFT